MPHRPGNDRDQRRLIDIAPSEMTAAGQVVQLVTQVPIPMSRVEMHHQLARGNQEYKRGRAQHRKQEPFVTALYRAPRHLRLRLRHHPRLLQIVSVAVRHHLIPREGREADIRNLDVLLLSHQHTSNLVSATKSTAWES